jgi:hypothetical protein
LRRPRQRRLHRRSPERTQIREAGHPHRTARDSGRTLSLHDRIRSHHQRARLAPLRWRHGLAGNRVAMRRPQSRVKQATLVGRWSQPTSWLAAAVLRRSSQNC